MNTDLLDNIPDDLITAQKAAVISGKSLSSVRAWVRQKKLTGYRQDPSKSNSALMVSLSELKVYLAGSTFNPIRQTGKKGGRPEQVTASLGKLNDEVQDLKSRLSISESKVETQQSLMKQQEEMIRELKEMREWLRTSLDEEKEKNKALQAQVIQVTAYLALPWWKKWNSNIPLLKG